jgi:hypothetical protein
VLIGFVILAGYSQKFKIKNPAIFEYEQILIYASTGSMLLAVLFYCLTLINPGYVPSRDDFIQVLQKMLDDSLHLDYLCI